MFQYKSLRYARQKCASLHKRNYWAFNNKTAAFNAQKIQENPAVRFIDFGIVYVCEKIYLVHLNLYPNI